ncbi:hypothetical protein [Plesiomonas shigelloides]|uniref:hypothetical protein n=1 Tax=Plesiomonas shigelloides TaxID=703 RepID=UPI001E4E7F90|nr:hypothetical protein [Plesiomonas shigelloides]
MMVKDDLSEKFDDAAAYKRYVENKKLDEEVVTLREWYETTEHHTDEINNYMIDFKNLGRLGKELHNRGVPRVTERYGDNIRMHVEATYKRHILNYAAPLCAVSCLYYKK